MSDPIKHDCDVIEQHEEYAFEHEFYGNAIAYVEWDSNAKVWYVHNNEYCTVIRFCPWCGTKLQDPPNG